jgi:hypothetical protein
MQEKDIITRLLGQPNLEGKEYIFFCPYCKYGKKKMSINFEKNKFKCWHCGRAGSSVRKIVYDFGSSSLIDEVNKFNDISGEFQKYEKLKNSIVQQEKPVELEWNIDYSLVPLYDTDNKHVEYLKNKRKMSYYDFVYWKPYVSTNEQYWEYVFFPSFDSEFKLNYYIARDITGLRKEKYHTPKGISKDKIIFNEHNIDWNKPITLVEGIFDAISGGENFIPILGSTLDVNSRLYEKIVISECETYLMLDGDALSKAKKIISNFMKFGIQIKLVKLPDSIDPGEMTRQEIMIAKQNYVVYNNNFEIKLEDLSV